MNKSKIEWCDMTWNPIAGCLHECEYCYAKGIARRFANGRHRLDSNGKVSAVTPLTQKPYLWELHEPRYSLSKSGELIKSAYPWGFDPTFHRYRLDEPSKIKTPQTIFVGSMADVFGEWVPNEWIEEVFKACKDNPQHRYLFLTKNSKRYIQILDKIHYLAETQYDGVETWLGTSINKRGDEYASLDWLFQAYDKPFGATRNIKCYLSIEPLQEQISTLPLSGISWVIVGAETGNRKGKVTPKREWIETIVNACRDAGVPVFLKNNLADIWGEPLVQEFPWEVR